MSNPPVVSLSLLLEEELRGLTALMESLRAERAALIAADCDDIERISLHKAGLLDTVAQLAQRRAEQRGRPVDTKARELWNTVRSTWLAARRANQVNGAIAHLHVARAARTQNVIHQLRGDGASYRADGRLAHQFS